MRPMVGSELQDVGQLLRVVLQIVPPDRSINTVVRETALKLANSVFVPAEYCQIDVEHPLLRSRSVNDLEAADDYDFA